MVSLYRLKILFYILADILHRLLNNNKLTTIDVLAYTYGNGLIKVIIDKNLYDKRINKRRKNRKVSMFT